MARQTLFTRIANAVTGKLTADAVRGRIEAAETAASEAERTWRLAALAVEAGGNPADEAAAEDHLREARRNLTRLQAVLLEVEAQNAEDARAAQAAQEASEDAEIAKAAAAWAKAAQAVAPAVASYATAYRDLVETGDRLRSLASTNPRVRQDLLIQHTDAMISLELARVCAGVVPPGADRWAVTSRDAREITPIASHIESVAANLLGSAPHE